MGAGLRCAVLDMAGASISDVDYIVIGNDSNANIPAKVAHVLRTPMESAASVVTPLVSPIALLVRSAAASEPALTVVLEDADAQWLDRMRHNARKLARRW